MKCSERGVVINFSSVTKKIDPSTGAMRPLTSAKQRCSLLLFLAHILSHRLVSQALAQHQWAYSVRFCHFCFKHPNTKKWLLWCPQGNQLQSKSLRMKLQCHCQRFGFCLFSPSLVSLFYFFTLHIMHSPFLFLSFCALVRFMAFWFLLLLK